MCLLSPFFLASWSLPSLPFPSIPFLLTLNPIFHNFMDDLSLCFLIFVYKYIAIYIYIYPYNVARLRLAMASAAFIKFQNILSFGRLRLVAPANKCRSSIAWVFFYDQWVYIYIHTYMSVYIYVYILGGCITTLIITLWFLVFLRLVPHFSLLIANVNKQTKKNSKRSLVLV